MLERTMLFIFSIFVLFGCKSHTSKLSLSLDLAGDNRQGLECVISHYKEESDSLKLKAAIFLIENLPGHKTYRAKKSFDVCFEMIAKSPIETNGRREHFDSILMNYCSSHNLYNQEWHSDQVVEKIKADFLIKNIDLAFSAWGKVPSKYRATFNEFCNFILPFYSNDEPIEYDARKCFFDKYKWVYDSLNEASSFKRVVDKIIKDFHFTNMPSISKYYAAPLNMNQIRKSKFGLCDDGVNYFVNLFRSLGIICCKDEIIQWGNHPSNGHSWIYLKYGTIEYATNIDFKEDGTDIRDKYSGESIPKAFRYSFGAIDNTERVYENNAFLLDVTDFYTPTTSICFPTHTKSGDKNYTLNIFNTSNNNCWKSICNGIKNGKDSIIFKKIGVNCVYIFGSWENDVFEPASYPFCVDSKKSLRFFIPSTSIFDSIELIRKTGWATARNCTKITWLNQLVGCTIEGSNHPYFQKADTLYKITPFFSGQKQIVNVHNKKKFRYIRFDSYQKESYLAYLQFKGENNNKLKGETIFNSLNNTFPIKNLFDDDPVSFCGGKDYFVGIKLREPQKIHQIIFQPRNDDNSIRLDDEYTLYCWINNQWQPIKTELAKDTMLHFYNIPKNCLMFLKDKTRGNEHTVFSMSSSGSRQLWYGFIN